MLTLGVLCFFFLQVKKTPEEIEEIKKRKEEARYTLKITCTVHNLRADCVAFMSVFFTLNVDNKCVTNTDLLTTRKLKEKRKKQQQENIKRKEKEKALNK